MPQQLRERLDVAHGPRPHRAERRVCGWAWIMDVQFGVLCKLMAWALSAVFMYPVFVSS